MESILEAIVGSTSDAVVTADVQGQVITWNPAAERIFGYSEDEILGQPLTFLIPERHREAHDAGLSRVIHTGETKIIGQTAQLTGLRKGGDEFPIELSLATWVTDGTRFFSGIIRDVTDRKQAEQALREHEQLLESILDHMPAPVYLRDLDGRFMLINRAYEDILRVTKDGVRGKTLHEVLPKILADDLQTLDPRVIKEGQVFEHEETHQLSDGKLVLAAVKFPIFDSSGEVVAVGGVDVDITERKRMEEELQAAYEIIKDQKERMESELNVGREIQMSFVPDFSSLPDRAEFSICATLEPAREVGGDFYDSYFLDEERFCFCIADVSGKGVPAALFMAMAKTLIKSRAGDDRSTASILTHVNDELSVDNPNCMFVTVFAGILNIRSGELLYTNAGHNPPYIRRKDGTLQRLDQRHGPAIAAMEGMVYKEEMDRLEPGDLLLLYTDGVTEAMDVDHHLFSEDRLKDLLTAKSTKGVQTAVDHTVAAVIAFEGEAERTDDVTVLALEFHGRPEDALRTD
jgi:PAS domain S-box-containing protein